MMGVNEDEVELNRKARRRSSKAKRQRRCDQVQRRKKDLICDPYAGKYHSKIS